MQTLQETAQLANLRYSAPRPKVTVQGFSQGAHGKFATHVADGTPHCGKDPEGLTHYEYEVLLRYHPQALDERGFLLDNTTFRNYFAEFRHSDVTISCERLACKVAEDLAGMLLSRMEFCKSIDVRIRPFQGVWVEAHYRPEIHTGTPTPAGNYLE